MTDTNVETAEAAIKGLESKQRELVERVTELEHERNKIAYSAHVEADPKSIKRLDTINSTLATLASEQLSIDAALSESQRRLNSAHRDEALAVDRANAEQLKLAAARLVELGAVLDDCWLDIASASTELREVITKIHNLGSNAPTHDQVRVLGLSAMKTGLMGTMWAKEFEHLAPKDRRSFQSLAAGWSEMLTANAAARLGTNQEAA